MESTITALIYVLYQNVSVQTSRKMFTKKMVITITCFALAFIVFVAQIAHTDDKIWYKVGAEGFSAGEANYISLVLDSTGTPYVAYEDVAHSGRATVSKFNGTTWETVGSAGFSAGEADYTSLALDASGTPYVAYRDDGNSNKLSVMKFNGTSWENVGSAGFSKGGASYISLAFDTSDIPYVAYNDAWNLHRATVLKFNGINWEAVGAEGFSTGSVVYNSLAFDSSNIPYIAYKSDGSSGKSTVMKYNGMDWEAVGSIGFSSGAVRYTSLAFDSSDTPHVAYIDGEESNKTTLMKFNGTTWELIGSAGFSSGSADYTSLAFDSMDMPYIAYRDGGNSNKVTVRKFSELITYEDAEDESTEGWSLYDADPAGATITNVYDATKDSQVIQLQGDGGGNGYRLRNTEVNNNWTNNQIVLQWQQQYSEYFKIYVSVGTTAGHRFLVYDAANSDDLGSWEYIHHGIGSTSNDGTWQTITRDLQADLHEAQPDVDITSFDSFMIRGNGRVDDITFMETIP